jgi:hypothetical protein
VLSKDEVEAASSSWPHGKEHDTARWRSDVGRGEAALGRGKDDTSWADVNFTGPKNEENSHYRFSCYK